MRPGVYAIVRRNCKCPDCQEDRWELRVHGFVCDGCWKGCGSMLETEEQVLDALAAYRTVGLVVEEGLTSAPSLDRVPHEAKAVPLIR